MSSRTVSLVALVAVFLLASVAVFAFRVANSDTVVIKADVGQMVLMNRQDGISFSPMVCSGDVRVGWVWEKEAYEKSDHIGAISYISPLKPVYAQWGAFCMPVLPECVTPHVNNLAYRMWHVNGCLGTCKYVFFYQDGAFDIDTTVTLEILKAESLSN